MSNLLQIHEAGQTPAPHEQKVAVGIDLGTTHSVIAMRCGDDVVAFDDASGASIIPSIVDYSTGEAIVGGKAVAGKRSISSIKRLMGKSYAEAVELMPHMADLLVEGEGGIARIKTANGDKNIVEISADILRHMKQIAENQLDEEVRQAVITVPAYFDDGARAATKDAAKLAGLEVLRLINEPTAAAFAYGLDGQAEGVYAIYDLGGGTFDISLLNLEKGVFQVLATAGDTALGGDDIDRLIANEFVKKFPSVAIDGELLQKARAAKEALSNSDSTIINHNDFEFKISSDTLRIISNNLINNTINICKQAVDDAGLTVEDIKDVVLVGGSTRLKDVRIVVEKYFGKKLLSDVDPDRVVAYGAAAQAHNLTAGDGSNLLLDVTPLSLGLETMGNIVEKVIYRNTPIPATFSQEFTTYKDGQTAMEIHVLQGEREMVADCRSLAKFTLRGIPPMTAGAARINITFNVDADGLLKVSAEEVTTEILQEVEVKPTYGLGLDEMEKMLRESMEHAKEDITTRLLQEAKVEAERTIYDINQALRADGDELLFENEIKTIKREIDAVQAAIYGNDRDMIDIRNQQLQHVTASFAQKRMDKSIEKALKGVSVDDI